MARNKKWFTIFRRSDSKSYRLTLNPTCGLPDRVCSEWYRTSFQHFPVELAHLRNPKNKDAAEAAAQTLIQYLKKKQEEEGSARRVSVDDITVGDWIKKFTELETSPRTGINASKNRPFSYETLNTYKGYYRLHVKDDPICSLKMAEVEEEDILEYMTRLSVSKLHNGRKMGGTRKFVLVVSFIRTAFNSYQRKNKQQSNPFQYIEKPTYYKTIRDALTEDEMVKFFIPGVLSDTMELAVCAAIFLSGLRRAEVSALKPEDLDWETPKITVCRSWQLFNNKNKELGPPKGKKPRKAPFDPVLQEAIKKLWKENGQHEYVFSYKDKNAVKVIGSSWIKGRFPKWLERAGIELGGRNIVPHSSRHSLASMLEARGVSLRYIQDLLGHSDLKTTKIYLHSPEKIIRDIGKKISDAMAQTTEQNPEENRVHNFKVS
jgi:integrase/recombinase XerD